MGSHPEDDTSYQPSEPKPCANSCGFFGTTSTMNLCSKCYKDFLIKENSNSTDSTIDALVESFKDVRILNSTPKSDSSPQSLFGVSSEALSSSSDQGPPKVANRRCNSCNKKVRLLGFVCKCGATFCGTHLYPEKHDCSYDYKDFGRDAIVRANPIIKGPKLDREV